MKLKKLITLLISVCCMLSFSIMHAQNRTAEGIVTDINDEALPGVAVYLKTDNNVGTMTDLDGHFSISVPENSELVFFSMGFMEETVIFQNGSKMKVVLKEDKNTLDEVIVVGYGTQRKGDVTGAISSLRGESMPKVGATTLGQSLKGQIAGVNFSQHSAQPGAAVWLQIRGAAAGASPLIIVDGVPVMTMWELDPGLPYGKGSKESVLDNINPNDIQDIQVLKDASATSIYGANAAGGVILITTKKGSEGKLNVDFNASYTAQWMAKKPELLSPRDYMREMNKYQLEKYVYEQEYFPWGDKPLPSEEELLREFNEAHAKDYNKGFIFNPDAIDSFNGGTDWYDEVTRTGHIQEYGLSINGGSDKGSYRVSLGYMGNDGIAKNNSYDRATGTIKLNRKFTDWLYGGISASYTALRSSDIALSGEHGVTPLFEACRLFDPTVPVRDYDGKLSDATLMDVPQVPIHPVSVMDMSMKSKKDNLLTSAYLDIRPMKGLSIMGIVGFDRKFASTGSYISSTTERGKPLKGIARVDHNELTNKYINIRASWDKTFNDAHHVSLMVGWEYQTSTSEGLAGKNTGFPYDGVLWHNLELGTNERPDVYSWLNKSENASVIARANYSYKSRYMITANYRLDGSSNFAPNRQWGNFGGVSVAWNIKNENWMKNVNWLSNLKIRAGYGVTGFAGSLTGTRTFYAPGADYAFNNKPNSGVRMAVLGNPNLSWESQYDVNVGLDFGFFQNRLGGTIDVYERTIKDRIGIKDLKSYQAINKMHYNTERVDKTRGVDFTLYAVPFSSRSFEWSTQFTLTYYRDMTVKRDPSDVLDINDEERFMWNDMWYYLSDGLLQPGEVNPGELPTERRAGEIKLKDVNGFLRDELGNKVFENGKPVYSGAPDGRLDAADLVKLGNNTPIPFSWNNNFRIHDFDITIGMYGKFNQWQENVYARVGYGSMEWGKNSWHMVKDRYSYDNLDSNLPSHRAWYGKGWGDYFLQKSWFIRLDNITLGYTLPKRLTKGVLQSVRFWGAMKNVATISPLKKLDPEYDIDFYPSVSSFTFGVDIKF